MQGRAEVATRVLDRRSSRSGNGGTAAGGRAPRYSYFDPLDRIDDVREWHPVMQHRLELVVAERNADGPAVASEGG